ncbi:hypothetical protein F4860DRAFT_494608 [Xylaria cubensis]|nr:hypothetical protein F4860DRAFT_494608 [Xylaria cubensis]
MNSFNRAQERALSASLNPMIQTIADHECTVLELPYTIKPSNSPLVEIKVTDRHTFAPLPEADLIVLEKAFKKRPKLFGSECQPSIFQAPGPYETQFSWWASRVTTTCRELTEEKELWTDNKKKAQYAGYSMQNTDLADSLLTAFIEGESMASACGVRWYVTAILKRASFDYGAILATHPMETLDLSPTRILRSEMLTLLALLRTASRRAVRAGTPCISPTVFLLSFAYDQVRVLEASIKTNNDINKVTEIHVSTQSAFNQIPIVEKRDEAYRKLYSWTMFSEEYNNYGYTLSLPVGSASTATTTTTTTDSLLNKEHSDGPSPDSSFIEDRDEEDK